MIFDYTESTKTTKMNKLKFWITIYPYTKIENIDSLMLKITKTSTGKMFKMNDLLTGWTLLHSINLKSCGDE